MVVVQLIGGLGNQLFQYAAAKSLAIEKKKKLCIDVSRFENYKLHNYTLNHFNIISNIYKRPNKYLKKIASFFQKSIYYKEDGFGYNKDLIHINGETIFLEGYFQSEKYFLKHEKEIRKDFEIISPLKSITKEKLELIRNVNSVSIHIRRGDYLTNPLHNTNKETYYKRALEIIENKISNPFFFIFSDDIEWVKFNFNLKHKTIFIDFNDALTNFEDLKLMSSCQHNIIANSSFSWWGAWLNENPEKIVIAPEKWFNDETINSNDIIPNSWIKL